MTFFFLFVPSQFENLLTMSVAAQCPQSRCKNLPFPKAVKLATAVRIFIAQVRSTIHNRESEAYTQIRGAGAGRILDSAVDPHGGAGIDRPHQRVLVGKGAGVAAFI